MKIDVSTIEGYEQMSVEDKLNALLEADIEDPNVAKLKDQLSKANGEASEWKKKHNALLSEDQQKDAEKEEALAQLQEELESLRKEKTVSTYTAKLLACGFSDKESSEAASALSEGKHDDFFKVLSNFKKNLEKSIKAELMKDNTKPEGSGGTDHIMTLDEFRKMDARDRAKFASEHPDEYRELYK